MYRSQPAERLTGIETYVSSTDGIGGRLRDRVSDFQVREREAIDPQSVDADTGSYPALVFRATLRNRDTNGFVNELASRLGISRERVTWSGTKDKRAITTQLFSIRDFEQNTLPSVSGAELEIVGRTGRPVLYGDHRGNDFEIVVRGVHPDATDRAAAITTALQQFGGEETDAGSETTVGVPNFFGPQRFGTIRPVTHEVGLAIVRGDWEQAVMTYLGNPSEDEPTETQAAREYVERTHDWEGAIERFPTHLRHERAIAHRLIETDVTGPDRFRAALTAVPTNLQTLFVHAAQSYLFNRMLSQRFERGLPFDRPVAGDVVCFLDDAGRPDPAQCQRVTASRTETIARHCDRGRAFVTAPLIGSDTELSDGEQGEIERDALDAVDLTPSAFELPGAFDSTGTRRPILLRTDLSIEAEQTDEQALAFSFSLPNGAYATVLLREYMKVPPSEME
ncbi:tRNA pseudouridine(13) synthase TruD [Halocatena pleomorpha]|uniref:Probable tRNA pseudouridine synthase D n=1 Tax=Halocatena pleomorpha TaxID=1785090 RepID=A0A3P3RCG3_9EURY|nr:tRNA pseudouridine(13) synthase TruD [Halocatena pleomorpha]RRJ31182.1 tRNA pseudouridine(13) synthase TruD [Halocatena pleomorpha]